MVDTPVEPIDSPIEIKQLRHQARYVYLTTSLIALGLTVIVLFI
jgi:hypothetical protein